MQITIACIATYCLNGLQGSNNATMKHCILLGFLAVTAAFPGIIHEEAPQVEEKYDHAPIGESEHQHHVQHEHAKSHQSIKFEHFHPVPVYVKKEYSHLLKHPLESGKSEQELKQIHPETQHIHGHGLVLEDHRLNTDHLKHGGHEHLSEGFEGGEALHGLSGGDYQLHQPSIQEGHYHQEDAESYKYEGY